MNARTRTAGAQRQAPTPPGPWLTGLPPQVDARARLVVLGSFPGVRSLQLQQYYGHPSNQFWTIVGALWGLDLARAPYERRLDEAARRGLGLWDVYVACERSGSLDSAIRHGEPGDVEQLLLWAPGLQAIVHNGAASARAMDRTRALGVRVYQLPSTSAAHARWSLERKLAAWRAVFELTGLA